MRPHRRVSRRLEVLIPSIQGIVSDQQLREILRVRAVLIPSIQGMVSDIQGMVSDS